MTRRAVFLDRDGTLIEDVPNLSATGNIAPFPWTADAVRALNRAGLAVVVVTNQAAVARGAVTEAQLDVLHQHLDARLRAGGAHVAAYYYCPHHPDGVVAEYSRECDCRKPAAGLVERAARDLDVDPRRSFVVGDKWSDVEHARGGGARGILVRTGHGAAAEASPRRNVTADAVVDNLAAAASWILLALTKG